MVFRTLVFGALSFVGFAADLFSISFSIAASLFLASVCLARASLADSEAASGLSLAFWIAEPARCANVPFTLLKAAALAAAAFALAISVGRMDWNFLFRKLTTLLIWLIAFRLFYRADLLRRVKPSSTGWMLACALLILPGYRTYEATRNEVWKHLNRPLTAAVFLDQWCGYDLSLKLIHDALTGETGSSDFYRFLVQNTNIAHSTAVSPVDINLAGKLEPAPGKKPNIFLIVVDSLRRDYLSPYNSSVDFTPEIAKFGSESVVMENAFTHYGGTGLSEPSIWVGGMMLHKQYVTPFAPMNSLQKLLRAERYRAYVSRDTILQVILGPWPEMIELDQNRANMDYDMCASLDELSGKVAADPGDRPIFAYTQPQNIHISVINRAGAKPVSNENYGSFYAPYASRLRRMDVCFGRFIAALKSKGIYDSSVVILTADHGDSLGEQGRWGHAYTVTPEVMRIPLIVHLPPEIRQSSYIKANGLAFSTDITPSLFYLTGHPPTERGELFGRPLFTQSPEEQAGGHRDSYLVASSYAAVYGILSGNGTSLSVSDAVDYKAYGFELGSMFPSAHSLSGSAQVANEKAIHRGIMAINQLYKFGASEQARGEK